MAVLDSQLLLRYHIQFFKMSELIELRKKLVIQNLMDGKSHVETANSMGLSEYTIKLYIRRLCRDYGVPKSDTIIPRIALAKAIFDAGDCPCSYCRIAALSKFADDMSAWRTIATDEQCKSN